jgi:phosphopantetheinyl transferase
MLVFIKHGDYERRRFIEDCFNKYMDFSKSVKTEQLEIAKGKNDKPYFKDYPEIRFSLSHSGDIVLLAIGKTEIGIDIEKIRNLDYSSLSDRYFAEGEKAEIKTLEDYFRVWTRKEAYLKLTSEGIKGLAQCDTSKPVTFEGDTIVFTPVDIFKDYMCTIAAPKQEILFMDYNE